MKEFGRRLKEIQSRLRAIADQLELLLEANQIESFQPDVGDCIETRSTRFNPVSISETGSPERHGCVAEVKRRGWVLVRGEADEHVICEAQVSVFGPTSDSPIDSGGVDEPIENPRETNPQ